MRKMSACVYNDFLAEPGSPLSSADESFSDSETSSSIAENNNHLSYLSDFFTGSSHHHHSETSASTDSDGGTPGGGSGGTGAAHGKSKGSRKPCKYVPHREKPVHVVEKRNARERRRVEAVNSAFVRLRRMVPHENRRKRISKVKTLRVAIDYIHYLQDMIEDHDSSQVQDLAGLQQVPGGGGGGGGGGVPHHPAYLPQGPAGWGSNNIRTREEILLQGPQYHHPNPHHQHHHHHQHQQQHQQPNQHIQPELVANNHTYVHHHQYQHPPNQHIFQQESVEENCYGARLTSLADCPGQAWPQSRVHIYSS